MPAIERRLAELPPAAAPWCACSCATRPTAGQWSSTARLDLRLVESLADAVQALELPQDDGLYLGGGRAQRHGRAASPSAGQRRIAQAHAAWPPTGSRARPTTMKT